MTDTELEIHNTWLLYHSLVTGMGLKPTEDGFVRFWRWLRRYREIRPATTTPNEDVIIEQARKCEEKL